MPFAKEIGIRAVLENFDYNARCEVVSFTLTRVEKSGKETVCHNVSGKFDEKTLSVVAAAKPGDTYHITEVQAHCPGDDFNRNLNELNFQIQ